MSTTQKPRDDAQIDEQRRRALQLIGAGATVAATGGMAGTAAADEDEGGFIDSFDPEVNTPSTEAELRELVWQLNTGSSSWEDLQDNNYQINAPPQNMVSYVGTMLFGGDNLSESGDQLILDSYGHLLDANESFKTFFKLLIDDLENSELNAKASAQYEIIEALNNGYGESQARMNARQGALDWYAGIQENMLRVIESMMFRLANVRDRQVVADGIPSSEISVSYYANGDYYNIIDYTEIEVELINGDVIETYAMIISPRNPDEVDDDYQDWIIHPYLVPDTLSNTQTYAMSDDENGLISYYVKNFDDLEEDEDRKPWFTVSHINYQRDGRDTVDHEEYFRVDEYDSDNTEFTIFPWPNEVSDEINLGQGRSASRNAKKQSWAAFFAEYVHDKAYLLANEMAEMTEDIYAAYDAGQLDTDDLTNPFVASQEMAEDYQESGHFGFAQLQAAQMGYSSQIGVTAVAEIVYDEDASTLNDRDEDDIEVDRTIEGGIAHNGIDVDVPLEVESGDWEPGVRISYDDPEDDDDVSEDWMDDVGSWRDRTTVEYREDDDDDWEEVSSVVEDDDDEITVWTANENGVRIEEPEGFNGDYDLRITVHVPMEIPRDEWFDVDDAVVYIIEDVDEDGDGGAVHTLDSADAFRLVEIYDRDGEEMESHGTRDINYETTDTDDLEDLFGRWLEMQQEAEEERDQVDWDAISDGFDGIGGGVSDTVDGLIRTLQIGGVAAFVLGLVYLLLGNSGGGGGGRPVHVHNKTNSGNNN